MLPDVLPLLPILPNSLRRAGSYYSLGGTGACVDASGNEYDCLYCWGKTLTECQHVCNQYEGCVGVDFIAASGNCEVRFTEGAVPGYDADCNGGSWHGGTGYGAPVAQNPDGSERVCYVKEVSCTDLPGDVSETAWHGGYGGCDDYAAGEFCAEYGGTDLGEGTANEKCCAPKTLLRAASVRQVVDSFGPRVFACAESRPYLCLGVSGMAADCSCSAW